MIFKFRGTSRRFTKIENDKSLLYPCKIHVPYDGNFYYKK